MPFVIRGTVDWEVEMLLNVLSTALWLAGGDDVSHVRNELAERMLRFFYAHAEEYFG